MNRCFPIFALFTVLLIVLPAMPTHATPIVIDAGEQFHFADSLMQRGEFDRAILEFERFIHFFPRDVRVPQAYCLMGVSHMKAGRYEKARKVFSKVLETHKADIYAQKALFLIGESYYEQGIPKESEYYFDSLIRRFPQSTLRYAALYRLGWAKMQENQWKAATRIFEGIEKSSPYYNSARNLAEASLKGETLPQKSPKLAGAMGAILPGLGHAYVGRYKDGGVALILNGLFVWATMEAFHNDNNALGVMLGFLELGWYSGSIYSAVNSAHKYNRKVRKDFLSRLKDQLDLKLLITPEGHAGLTISFRF